MQEFNNYSPRVFGSIEGAEDVLASRIIEIPMMRSFKKHILNLEVNLVDKEFEKLRTSLFLVAMDYGAYVAKLYAELVKPPELAFDGREWNMFKPIYAIGLAIGTNDLRNTLIDFANTSYRAKAAKFNKISSENAVLEALVEIVKEDGLYPIDYLHAQVLEHIKSHGLDLGVMTKHKFGKLLSRLDVINEKDRKGEKDEPKTTKYRMAPERIRLVAENRGVI